MQTQTLSKPRLDRDARREAILDVAQQVFLEEGFAAASMSTIAARLGGSKGTLYNYFKSKDDLFNAYVERRCLWQQDEIFECLPGEAPAAALQRVARSFLAHILNDTTLRNFRLIAAEAERSPEIGRSFYEKGPLQGTGRLAQLIADLEARGFLDVDGDPLTAAQHLLGLVQSPTFKGRLCNAIPPLTAGQIDAEAARGVKTFLKAFGRRP
jgi:AcrR family transcriptional regulator